MSDERIESIVRALSCADLRSLDSSSRETDVGRVLSASLSAFQRAAVRRSVGIDGSVRNPDDARVVPSTSSGAALDLAIEYKLYRDRKTGAGELDRALGQSVAYAENYGAVLFFVVFTAQPRDPLPPHWLDRTRPFTAGREGRVVPIYFAVRPLDWNAPWAPRVGTNPER